MPRYTKPKKTLNYGKKFKVKAVELSLLDDLKVKEVAESLDIHPYMLSKWRRSYREGKLGPIKRIKTKAMKKETKELNKVNKLEKENARLRQENNLLKKWQRFLAEEQLNDLASSKNTGQNLE